MNERTEEMRLSSIGLLLLLAAAAMTLLADFGPRPATSVKSNIAYQQLAR